MVVLIFTAASTYNDPRVSTTDACETSCPISNYLGDAPMIVPEFIPNGWARDEIYYGDKGLALPPVIPRPRGPFRYRQRPCTRSNP